MTFSLATIAVDGVPTPTLVVDGRHFRLADVLPEPHGSAAGLISLFERWEGAEPVLLATAQRLAADPGSAPAVATPDRLEDWLTPLQYPRKVVCTGSNYYDHVTKDGGHTGFSKDDNVPVFFLKPPTTTLVGQGRSVRYPVQSSKFDYELELAVVIGKRGRGISVADAKDHVAGYTIGIDLSARDWQRHPQHLVKFDLFGGKAFDDSCPLGPAIVPARFVDDANLQLQFWVNGELRQDANTSDMIWDVAEQVALISEHLTLEPGDVIMTGTPAGVGLATGTWLKVGDRLEGRITGLGSLTVDIVDDLS
jgi:2-keto-4-pentenoate hydratase/2-oxohepta-3-ene-1,7-dioic acid hydratase in catechol pathway